MSAVNFSPRHLASLLVLLACCTAAGAQSAAQRLPITIDSVGSEADLRNKRMVFRGLRITQGSIGIEADVGTTAIHAGGAGDFSDSTWTFEGNVRIEIETAKIIGDSAELFFENHTLQRARIAGRPARFADSGRVDGRAIEAEATSFNYDLGQNEIRFTGDARLAEGNNEVTGSDLLYDLADQRLRFSGDEQERFRMTISPDETPVTDDPEASDLPNR